MKTIIAVIATCWFGAAHAVPNLDAAFARAAIERKPLVVEVYTSWCGPCEIFEEDVLPDPRVQKALGGVVFVRYDAEQVPGNEVPRRYRICAYPTFLVLDARRAERIRREGLLNADQFIELIGRARALR